jgi:hypothetical protein
MSKLYVFGIGGTGSRVLRSLTMLMAAGVKMNVGEIVPIIIDPDMANADLTRTFDAMRSYNGIRKKLSFIKENKSLFFRTEIKDVLNGFTLHVNNTDDRPFRNFIDFPSMDKANQALAQMLFSEKNLNSQMNVGFKGNPNIGSVVLNQIINSPDFIAFANSFAQGDKIFIISSIFGGTGASGFPLLLKTFRNGTNFPNNGLINNAEIGAITILPYFNLKTDDDSEIDSSTFISKSKSALAYYEKNISNTNQINAIYFLGDDVASTYANHEGGALQLNDAHLVEFLASTAIVDFCNNSYNSGTTMNKEVGLNIANNVNSLTFKSFYGGMNQMFRTPLTQFTLMSNCLLEKMNFVSSHRLKANDILGLSKDFYKTTFMHNLLDFFKTCISSDKNDYSYHHWLTELKKNKRSLDLFNLECGDKPFEVVNGVHAEKVQSIKSNYELFYTRLNKVARKCVSKTSEDKLIEMYYLATQILVKEIFKF